VALNNIGSTADIAQIASRLMDRVDANRDGQLSKEEFGTFLTTLLQGVSQVSPTSLSPSAIATRGLVRAAAVSPNYTPVPGFVTEKMNDLTHTTLKYQFIRAVQDLGLLGTPTTSNLQAIVDHLAQNGVTASVTGDDTIDFGEGSVDVIFSVGDPGARWQWLPTA
jgi:hypothetical protein